MQSGNRTLLLYIVLDCVIHLWYGRLWKALQDNKQNKQNISTQCHSLQAAVGKRYNQSGNQTLDNAICTIYKHLDKHRIKLDTPFPFRLYIEVHIE